MTKRVTVEVSLCNLAQGVTEEELVKASDKLQTDFIQNHPGYIDRELVKGEGGQWADIIHRDSLEEAKVFRICRLSA